MRLARRGKILSLSDRTFGSWLVYGASVALALLAGWLSFFAGPLTLELQLLAFTCAISVFAMISADLTKLPRMTTVIDREAGTVRVLWRDGGRFGEDRLALSEVIGVGVLSNSYADGGSLWQLALIKREGAPVPVSLPTRSAPVSLEPLSRTLRGELGLSSSGDLVPIPAAPDRRH